MSDLIKEIRDTWAEGWPARLCLLLNAVALVWGGLALVLIAVGASSCN